jgi:hypothetical protein
MEDILYSRVLLKGGLYDEENTDEKGNVPIGYWESSQKTLGGHNYYCSVLMFVDPVGDIGEYRLAYEAVVHQVRMNMPNYETEVYSFLDARRFLEKTLSTISGEDVKVDF